MRFDPALTAWGFESIRRCGILAAWRSTFRLKT